MRRVPRRQGQLGIEGPRRMAPFDGHGQVRHQLRSLVEATGLEKLEKSWENAMIMEISHGKNDEKNLQNWKYHGNMMANICDYHGIYNKELLAYDGNIME